tara:strand:+ start:853 stop:2055 length:1203 start_codon:yes stop_codon:yes gene_type:complete
MPIRVGVAGTTQFLDDRIIFPVSPSDPVGVGTAQGEMYFNSTDNKLKRYGANNVWSILGQAVTGYHHPYTGDGSSSSNPAYSAKSLYDRGIVTSGKSLKWISTSGGVKQVWCDFDTQDEDGNSGWMLVAHFDQCQHWGGKGVSVTTSTGDIHNNHSGYNISANFYNADVRRFRITVNADVNNGTNLGSSLSSNANAADWYYDWDKTLQWKKIWAPADGWSSGQRFYVSKVVGVNSPGATEPDRKRQSIHIFDHAYNLRDGYSVAQKHACITDYGNSGAGYEDTTEGYFYSTQGETAESPLAGFFDMWGALSTNGSKFEMYDVGRSANYSAGTGGDTDGTLAILQQNPASGYDKVGQDIDSNLAVKIGQDDNLLWATQNGASGGGNANTNLINVDMWWWIK